jgi:hypothetical protein
MIQQYGFIYNNWSNIQPISCLIKINCRGLQQQLCLEAITVQVSLFNVKNDDLKGF